MSESKDHVAGSSVQNSTPSEVLQQILNSLANVDDSTKVRLLQTAAAFFGLKFRGGGFSMIPQSSEAIASVDEYEEVGNERKPISPKDFMLDKSPRTDVERVASLAYYLTHYQNQPHFKTIDISKLNTEAAQPKFSNAALSVNNATKRGYLVPAVKGHKQLTHGRRAICWGVPDNSAQALELMRRHRPKRHGRRNGRLSTELRTTDGDKAMESECVRIACFNHKGGVGKTTLSVNVGEAWRNLATESLLLDSDPQCNLNAHVIESTVVDDLLNHSDSKSGRTIWSAMKPVCEGTGDFSASGL